MKSYGVTIQMKPLCQHFCLVLFVCLFVFFFKKFKKERVKFYFGIKLTIKDC